jgi:23S rRNA pseudouridine2457 synthase
MNRASVRHLLDRHRSVMYIRDMSTGTRIICVLFFKPYGVVSQFTREGAWLSLRDFGPFPEGVYPAGRLDADSEGMLLLTNDNWIKQRLTDPVFRHPRTYAVQVERVPGDAALGMLRSGVNIEGKKTRPAQVRIIVPEPPFPERATPIRIRKRIPTAWLELILTEGRNRQVRRMTAAVGHPTLRLIRTRIGDLTLDGLAPGSRRELHTREVERLCRTLRMF